MKADLWSTKYHNIHYERWKRIHGEPKAARGLSVIYIGWGLELLAAVIRMSSSYSDDQGHLLLWQLLGKLFPRNKISQKSARQMAVTTWSLHSAAGPILLTEMTHVLRPKTFIGNGWLTSRQGPRNGISYQMSISMQVSNGSEYHHKKY